MDALPRTAIATIWDGDHRLACGIPLWCQGARLLAQQIPRSQIVLLSQQPSEDCTEATVVWSEETAAAAAAYVASHVLRRSEVQTALLKFAMFSLSFDLVLQVRDGAALSTVRTWHLHVRGAAQCSIAPMEPAHSSRSTSTPTSRRRTTPSASTCGAGTSPPSWPPTSSSSACPTTARPSTAACGSPSRAAGYTKRCQPQRSP